MFYADSGLWTAVHHGIPVLYVIPNNQGYGIVANYFGLAEGAMKQTNEYHGVVLDGIDPVQIAAGFGVAGRRVQEESGLDEALAHGLQVVEQERRPFLLDVRLPLGLPRRGRMPGHFVWRRSRRARLLRRASWARQCGGGSSVNQARRRGVHLPRNLRPCVLVGRPLARLDRSRPRSYR